MAPVQEDERDERAVALDLRGAAPPAPAAATYAKFVARDSGLTARQAVALHREGFRYHHLGDPARAEAPLAKAHFFCLKNYGPDHPATKSSAKHLAEVYKLAFNAGGEWKFVTLQANNAPQNALDESAGKLRERLAAQPTGEIKAQVVPVLTQALKSAPAAEYRRELVRALGQLGPAAEPAVPALAERLKQASDPDEMHDVLLALEQMGEAARTAVPALAELSGEAVRGSRVSPPAPAPPAPRSLTSDKSARKREVGDRERRLAARVLHRLQGCEGRVGVRDEAGCFTLRTVRVGCEQLCELARTSGVEVLVETSRGAEVAPAALAKLGPRAVHVVIDPTGPSVRVGLSKQLQREGFRAEAVREPLIDCCRKRQFDRALADGVKAIRGQLAKAKK
jgi:hypothetical protein